MATGKQTGNETSSERCKIKVSKNGPYLVSGAIPLSQQIIGTDAEGYSCEWRTGNEYPAQENYALCRCGKSSNKPFCDASHAYI